MKYFIRTTLERQLDSSYSQIEYELLVDTEHKPLKSLIAQYKYISQFDCVLLEDDLILCKDFKNRIEEVISKNPNKIINFFYRPTIYTLSTEDKHKFAFSQCRYYPKGITDKIASILETYNYEKANTTARYVTDACNELGYEVLHYRPCLVQHLENGSLIGITRKDRRSPYFIDYLDELNISYADANLPENKEKLISLMKEKFKEIDDKWNQF